LAQILHNIVSYHTTRDYMPKLVDRVAARSLEQFARDKRRANCPVCKLDLSIRKQIVAARERKVPRAVIFSWLTEEHHARITDRDLTLHAAGRHDTP
jgi:hypothetical protein